MLHRNNKNPFDALPNEVIAFIASFLQVPGLNQPNLNQLALVNKRFYKILKNSLRFKLEFDDQLEEMFSQGSKETILEDIKESFANKEVKGLSKLQPALF